MSQRALAGSQFADHVAAFAAEHPEHATPEGADSQCYEASSAFARRTGGRVGYYAKPVGATRLPDWHDPNSDDEDNSVGHSAAHVGDKVVDFTARQFWPDAPHPLIEDRATYRRRFREYQGEGR